MGINGATGPDEQDAQDLFPHTRLCTERIRSATMIHGKAVQCSCKARVRRRSFLFLIKRTRRQAYVDAYAKIRHEARQRAGRANTPQERQAFEEMASWAESLELGHLEE